MPRFLIDANLPYRFAIWRGPDCQHVFDINDAWSDGEIWRYAREHDLVIVSKDADFSDWIMLSEPPPRLVHLRIGNMKMKDFHAFMRRVWPVIRELIESHKLLIVHEHSIECVA
jgi:predicted nuclease of predicted toxin-antitoxin system